MTTITALPTPPSRSTDDAATFSSKADTFVAALQTFGAEANLVAAETNAASAGALAASAAATAVVGAAKWAGTTVSYTQGNAVWSGVNFKTYRLSIASKTANVANTDPSIDTASWALVNGTGDVIATATQTLTNKSMASPVVTGVISNALGAAALPSYSFTGDLNTGAWSPGADAYAVSTGGVERMRVNSAGNVGIGTASPTTKLHVVSGSSGGATFTGTYAFAAANYNIRIINDGAASGYIGQSAGVGGISIAAGMSYRGVGSWMPDTTSASAMLMVNGVTSFFGDSGLTAGVSYTPFEKMRLDAAGRLLLGVELPGYQNSNSISLEPSVGYSVHNHPTSAASGSAFIFFGYAANGIGSITQSGTTAVLYSTTSDRRLKTNIVDAPEASAHIDSIKIRSFDWISDGSHQRFGMVAQELFEVAPEAVHTPADPAEMMAVDYSKLVPMLIKEVQSLRARVAALEA